MLGRARQRHRDRHGAEGRGRVGRRHVPLLRRSARQGLRRDRPDRAAGVLGLVHREPVGVVGAIVPWNFPLMIGAWKLAPALAAGNSVVLKPAETASLSLLRLAELAAEAGLPDGRAERGDRPGRVAGEALALSMDVDVLVFTGSGATGRRLLEYAARSNLKRVYLELGGKSPNIVFADAPDLAQAARVSAVRRSSATRGRSVSRARGCWSRRTIHDDFVEALCQMRRQALRVGDPLDLGIGHRRGQFEATARAAISASSPGALDGGRAVAHWRRRASCRRPAGSYMEPTVVTGVKPRARIAQRGGVRAGAGRDPVRHRGRGRRASPMRTDYGLAAGVWTGESVARPPDGARRARGRGACEHLWRGGSSPCRSAA